MKKATLFTLLAGAVMVFGFTFTAMAEVGVTDTEIHIGQWGPQTGPAAPWGSVARGTDAFFKMINAEGGIHGRKIVYHMFDDGYNPAKTMAGVKELQEGWNICLGIRSWYGSRPGSEGLSHEEKDPLGRICFRFSRMDHTSRKISVCDLSIIF